MPSQNVRYSIGIEDAQDIVKFSVEFHRKDIRAIKRAIQSHVRGRITVERLPDGGCRISLSSDKIKTAIEPRHTLRSLYGSFSALVA